MHNLTFQELQKLTEYEDDLFLSIYMPTVQSGSETRQNPINFKNQLKKAEGLLENCGKTQREIESLLDPAYAHLEDTIFWQKQKQGFAAFLGKDLYQYFLLPSSVRESVTVERRFNIKPLTPLLLQNGEYYLLCLNLNNIQLYKCTRFTFDEIDLDEFPTSIKEAYADYEFEKQLSFHTEAPRRSSKRDAQFFSRGDVGKEDMKQSVYRYLKDVSKTFHSVIDNHNLPLILAGVEYVVGMYREINSYPHIYDEWINGSPEQVKIQDLHKISWDIASALFEKHVSDAIRMYSNKLGSGYTSDSTKEITSAAYNKRVDTLFFNPHKMIWGIFDYDKQEAYITDDNTRTRDELINFAVIHTLKNKGKLYPIDEKHLPENSPVAAIYRY